MMLHARPLMVSLMMLITLASFASSSILPVSAGTMSGVDLQNSRARQTDKLYDYLARYAAVVSLTHQELYGPLLPASEKLCKDFISEGLNNPSISSKIKCPSGLDEVTPLIRVPTSYGNVWSRLYLEILETRAVARSHSAGKIAEALADHEKVLAECPDFIEARVGLANHYRLTKQFDKAVAEIDKAIQKNPKHSIAWTTKAMIYEDLRNYAMQREALAESYKISAAEEREINSFMNAPTRHNEDLDPKHALRLINFRPRNANAIATYAESINPPRTHDAFKYATIAVNLDPSGELVRKIRADINLDLGNFVDAATDATIPIKLAPELLDARITRGLAYLNMNKSTEALADLDFVIERQPNFTDAYNYRAVIFLSTGQPRKALADAKKAVTLEPEYPLAYSYLGASYSRLGMISNAKQAFETAVRLERKFRGYATSPSRFNLGSCYLRMKQPELANREFDQALLADPLAPKKMFERCCSAAQLGCRDAELKTALATGVLPKQPLVDLEKIKDSLTLFTRFSTLNSRSNDIRFEKAFSALCINDTGTALAEFRSLLRLDRNSRYRNFETPLLLLSLERNNHLTEDAKVEVRRTLNAEPRGNGDRAMVSLSRFLLGEASESQALNDAHSVSDRTRVHAFLAFHYLSTGDRARAKQHLEWAIFQGDRNSPEFILALTELQRFCGRS